MRLNHEHLSNPTRYPIQVIQFGEGNFLRAFADWMIHRMNHELNCQMGVAVVQPRNSQKVKELMAQDGLYTLITQGIHQGELKQETTVIDCLQEGVNTYENYDAYLKLAEAPDLKLMISNTTEAGIVYSETDELSDRPQSSFPGKLTALLHHRFKTFNGDSSKGLLHLPCELIEENGSKLKEIVLKLAKRWQLEPAFVQWVEKHNIFYNTLVDRIVPGYPADEAATLEKELGYTDPFMVTSEWYHLWVIEGPDVIKDVFPADKLGLNVLFVDDLALYRERKVRILNGAHTAMVPVGYLYGLETVGETVENDITGAFVAAVMYEDIAAMVPMPAAEVKAYADSILDRFRNPFIRHQLLSISLNSMSKFNTRLMPTLNDYVVKGENLPAKILFSFASLLYFYRGKRGDEIIPLSDDPHVMEVFSKQWQAWENNEISLEQLVTEVLAMESIWGRDLNQLKGLAQGLVSHLKNITTKPYAEALQEVLK
ncbi:tagaturonate reductase [Anoxynatronum buryatiense]|uniref:Tagaturonate reductase n=1 Tax=Anoxynatronum buryatiense TaxID=489973 RepID=A0AA45WT28_9CLOT|nr:tagaturonate reductase [Anoxynatronum buryatiense]SMP40358.1 tagaturonate reductase [Anoxynatronum buryatiense]